MGQSARPQVDYVPVVNGELDWGHQVSFPVDAAGRASVTIVFGQPVEFQIDFYALSQIFSWVPGASASASDFETAVMNMLIVDESEGEPVEQFAVTSESGTPYTASGGVEGVPGEGAI